MIFVLFKQKTAYEMRISDWSSDVCSSDLSSATAWKSFRIQSAPIQAVAEEGTCRQSQSMVPGFARTFQVQGGRKLDSPGGSAEKRPTRSSFVQIGRASGRERVCQSV